MKVLPLGRRWTLTGAIPSSFHSTVPRKSRSVTRFVSATRMCWLARTWASEGPSSPVRAQRCFAVRAQRGDRIRLGLNQQGITTQTSARSRPRPLPRGGGGCAEYGRIALGSLGPRAPGRTAFFAIDVALGQILRSCLAG